MRKLIIMVLPILCFVFLSGNAYSQEAKWSANFGPTGVDGTVKAIIQWGDSTVIAGNINSLPGSSYSSEFVIYDNIDKSWHLIKNGPDGEIRALAVTDNGELIIGGDFSFTYAGQTMANICKYDKQGNWSTLSGDANDFVVGSVNALLWHDSTLYLGGEFINPFPAFAVWDESFGFKSPPNHLQGFFNPEPVVNAITYSESHGDKIYIGGEFIFAEGETPGINVARVDLSTFAFEAIGLEVLGPVYSLYTNNDVYYQDKLVVGGEFHEVVTDNELPEHELCQNIIVFDVVTNTYDSLSGGVNGPVYSISKYDEANHLNDAILVGGAFDSTAATFSGPIARWDEGAGGAWIEYNDFMESGILYALDVGRTWITPGGDFESLNDSIKVSNIFSFKKHYLDKWKPFGDGLANSNDLTRLFVNDVAVDDVGNA